MVHTYYFSASNTTEKIVKAVADNLRQEVLHHNITPSRIARTVNPAKDDIVIFAAPVYAGRIPVVAAEKFKKIIGSGQKCVAIVVYGNRDYDDALIELCDLLNDNGFNIIAAAAFVAQHSIFPKVAALRPDADDLKKIADFSSDVNKSFDRELSFDMSSVKGNRPYKTPAAIPLIPKTNKNKCNKCGKCSHECPTGAIDLNNPRITDPEKCISCGRCIAVCPENARHFGGLKYKLIAPLFKKKSSARREPEWFVAG